jgi:polyisoprenoid-binding protein YceI
MTWNLDPHHVSVAFSAKHMGVSTVRGRFDEVTGALNLDDANDPTTGSGTVTIKAASVNTNSEMRDGHIKGADFLDVEKYPEIVFTVKSIKQSGDDHYSVDADLTIKGVTKPVTLDYEHNGLAVDPYGNNKVGGTLTGTINRTDWGLAWNVPLGGGGLLVGEKVKLEIDAELTEVKAEVPETAEAPSTVSA